MIGGRLMNEGDASVEAFASENTVGERGAGVLLMQAREAAGLSVDALAATLKVPVGKLEALEASRWDRLPDTVFARALALSVCRVLKVDPAPVMAAMPGIKVRPMADDQGINRPFKDASASSGGLTSQLSRPLLIAVAVLLFGALALVFFPTLKPLAEWLPGESKAQPEVNSLPAGSLTSPLESVNKTDSASGILSSTGVVSGAGSDVATAAPLAQSTLSAPPALAASQVASSTASVTIKTDVASNDGLVFSTRGDSWIEVTDTRGNVVFKQLMTAGQTATVSGAGPLSIVVGRADVTSLAVKGKTFDFSASTRNNVARFEISP